MQCGAKCFLVQVEKTNGQFEVIEVIARNQVAARKTVHSQKEDVKKIVKVKQK